MRRRYEPTLLPASAADTEVLYALIVDAAHYLAMQGFDNWSPPYPAERFAADVERGVVIGVWDHDRAVATFTLAPEPPRPYEPHIRWAAPDAPALYLNRLAIDPTRQRSGLGSWCLSMIDELAQNERAVAVRCDVLAVNDGVRAFYERHGYAYRGTRTHLGREFASYERVL